MLDLLRSLWREPRPVPAPPPQMWWDWALVGILVPVAVLEGLLRQGMTPRWLSIVVAVGIVLTLLWRRSRPLLMIAVAMGASVLASLVVGREFPDQNVLVCVLLLLFSLTRWGSGREAALGAAIMVGKMSLSAVLGYMNPGEVLGGFAIISASMALGAALRYRTRARNRELDQVKLLERERLARDLHDTVAHHVSAMAIRAQAGIATAASDPAAAVDALRVIDAEAALALDEMRGVVRILRAEQPADLAPEPRIADLARLVSRTGPPVDVEVVGDADRLPAPVGAAVFRLAQEAVTNARRHARQASCIDVRVVVDETSVRLRVSDDGMPGPRRTDGYGLVGMSERAGLLGGTCEAGPNAGRGWTVTAELPRTGAST